MVEAEPAADEARVLAGGQRRRDEDRGRARRPRAARAARPRRRRAPRRSRRARPRRRARARPAPGSASTWAASGERALRELVEPLGRARGAPPASAASASTRHERRLDRELAQAPAARGRGDRPRAAARRRARPGRAHVPAAATARLAAGALDVGREPAQPGARDAPAEPGRGRLLEPVGLVEDDRVVLGQHAAAGGEVGEVERVVRDHELGLAGARAARPPRSRSRRSGQRRPAQRSEPTESSAQSASDGSSGSSARSPVSVVGEPGLERLEGLPRRAGSRSSIGPKLCELLAAEVVLAALEHARRRPRARARAPRPGRPWRAAAPGAPWSRSRRRRAGPTRAPAAGRRGSCRCRCPASATRCSPGREREGDRLGERGLLGPGREAGKGRGERAAGANASCTRLQAYGRRTAVPGAPRERAPTRKSPLRATFCRAAGIDRTRPRRIASPRRIR